MKAGPSSSAPSAGRGDLAGGLSQPLLLLVFSSHPLHELHLSPLATLLDGQELTLSDDSQLHLPGTVSHNSFFSPPEFLLKVHNHCIFGLLVPCLDYKINVFSV